MRVTWRFSILAAAILTATACATAGPYRANDGASGYVERQLGTTHWRVEFIGDDLTSRDMVETYLLFRAATLTVENGHDWFAMAAPEVSEDSEIVIEARRPHAYRDRYWRPHWRQRGRLAWSDLDPPRTIPSDRRPIAEPQLAPGVRYSASAEIFMGDGTLPQGAFDARATLAQLGPSMVRPSTE